MATLERIYTIPLGDAYMRVRNKRGKRAVAFARAFALRHMKASSVKVSEGVNSLILRDGIQKPPRRIKVRIMKGDDGVAKIWLIGEEEKIKAALDAKKKQEEQRKKEAEKKADEAKKKADEAKKPADDAKKAAVPGTSAAAGSQKPAAAPQTAPLAQKPAAVPTAQKTAQPSTAPQTAAPKMAPSTAPSPAVQQQKK